MSGEHERGGLLTSDEQDADEFNTLQKLCCENRVNALEDLRRIGLLKKNDIREQSLLLPSIIYNNAYESETFEYFLNWDPDALVNTMYDRHPLVQAICRFENSDSDCKEKALAVALKAGFKYHSEIGGLLFIEDEWDVKAFDFAYNEFGIMKVMQMLQKILSPACKYPILHHICIKAPRHKDLFMMQFPWAYQLRDSEGRSLHQAILVAGPDVMNSNDILFATLTDSQIQTKDPITTLYPFAAMAVGKHADLKNCFYLLCRQPSVLDKRSRANNESRRPRRCRKKRKMIDTVIDS
ncbi:predicted protein [Chaetoceros tenuissimus]|uniref:Uncharacterized protein n=1 Tax=Chaetoceros tenuissimus TaxID=426638 RepID=A0AAD3CPX7_9STRA|nr:predicted protein [Chaetoceros tenuissimus]